MSFLLSLPGKLLICLGVVMIADGFKVMVTELRFVQTLIWPPRELWPSSQGAHHSVSFGTR